MTDKEKAKAYDMALERARKELKQDLHESGVWAIQRIFPELRESEEEQALRIIKKRMCYDPAPISDEDRRIVENWLEKKKEQKPVEIHIDNPNVQKVDPNVKISTNDSSASGDELLYVSNKSYRLGYQDGKREAEQKPAEWNEEDERILKGIIGLVDHDQHYGVGNKEMLAWLKSLRPRPSWKPSEEQMMALHYASYGGELSPDELLLLDSLYNQLSELM